MVFYFCIVDGMFKTYRFFLCWTYCEDSKNLGGLQVGGGINVNNALNYIEEGASHVIVTSVCHVLCAHILPCICLLGIFVVPATRLHIFIVDGGWEE